MPIVTIKGMPTEFGNAVATVVAKTAMKNLVNDEIPEIVAGIYMLEIIAEQVSVFLPIDHVVERDRQALIAEISGLYPEPANRAPELLAELCDAIRCALHEFALTYIGRGVFIEVLASPFDLSKSGIASSMT